MSKKWYVLQFKRNSHLQAIRNLRHQGFETFLPLHDTAIRKFDRFINTSKPLFPGYMFVSFDIAESDWHKINSTYGVSRLITFNSILKPIPTRFIESLMRRYDSSGKLIPIEKLKKGAQVTVLTGPFANFIATVEKYEGDQRISIFMDLMGRETKIITQPDTLKLYA